MSLILCIETSTKACSTALYEGENLLAERSLLTEEFVHSEKLTVFVQEIMQQTGKKFTELSAVAVSRGPGSYTGLRIGVSSAKGICYALDIPLIAVDTLELLALNALEKEEIGEDHFLCPMLDARRMEVYAAVYSGKAELIAKAEPRILDEFSFNDYLNIGICWFFGDGSLKLRQLEEQHPNARYIDGLYPESKHMIRPAQKKIREKQFEDLAYFEPEYLKEFYSPPAKK